MWLKMSAKPKIVEGYEKLADNFRELAKLVEKDGLEKIERLSKVMKAKQMMSEPRTIVMDHERLNK